ncbi:hypothetical protein BGZ63DRAFT_460912 [Mariannaea sp. PMI_226]|nr:hypothetical protein BGZ63DRAFT_460912 [Mariannaea sp. PMI_226]
MCRKVYRCHQCNHVVQDLSRTEICSASRYEGSRNCLVFFLPRPQPCVITKYIRQSRNYCPSCKKYQGEQKAHKARQKLNQGKDKDLLQVAVPAANRSMSLCREATRRGTETSFKLANASVQAPAAARTRSRRGVYQPSQLEVDEEEYEPLSRYDNDTAGYYGSMPYRGDSDTHLHAQLYSMPQWQPYEPPFDHPTRQACALPETTITTEPVSPLSPSDLYAPTVAISRDDEYVQYQV